MLSHDSIGYALTAATIVAVVASVVGYFLVLRGQTFAGHALGHVGFAGAIGAMLIGVSPLFGLALTTAFAAVGMGMGGERFTQRDVSVGLVLATFLGIGLLFLHFDASLESRAMALLFGNIFTIGPNTVLALLALSIPTVAVFAAISRPLLFASLQPELAEARGISLRTYGILFLIIAAMATTECIKIVGVLLVFALMVAPTAAAQQVTRSVAAGVLLSMLLAVSVTWLGIVLAFYTDWPGGFWITTLSVASYLVAVLVRRRGLHPLQRPGRRSRDT